MKCKIKSSIGLVGLVVSTLSLMYLMILSLFQTMFGAMMPTPVLISGILCGILPIIASVMMINTADHYSKADFIEVVLLVIAGASYFIVKNNPFGIFQLVFFIMAVILQVRLIVMIVHAKKEQEEGPEKIRRDMMKKDCKKRKKLEKSSKKEEAVTEEEQE